MTTHEELLWTSQTKLELYAADNELWSQYADTGVRVDGVGTILPDSPDGESGSQGPFEPFHVITAIQPGEAEPIDLQRARLELLDQHLAEGGIRAVQAVGFALHADYSEESRAVFGLSDSGACELGRQFGQVAVFGITVDKFVLLACAGDRTESRGWYFDNQVLSDEVAPSHVHLRDEEVQRLSLAAAHQILSTPRYEKLVGDAESYLGDNPDLARSVEPALARLSELPSHRVYINAEVAIAGHYLLSQRLGHRLAANEYFSIVRNGGRRLTTLRTPLQITWIEDAASAEVSGGEHQNQK